MAQDKICALGTLYLGPFAIFFKPLLSITVSGFYIAKKLQR
jgi:hypothetical protein